LDVNDTAWVPQSAVTIDAGEETEAERWDDTDCGPDLDWDAIKPIPF
jgi:hypothetical protein